MEEHTIIIVRSSNWPLVSLFVVEPKAARREIFIAASTSFVASIAVALAAQLLQLFPILQDHSHPMNSRPPYEPVEPTESHCIWSKKNITRVQGLQV
jgi:pyruvate-formate lyase-activating enzyme